MAIPLLLLGGVLMALLPHATDAEAASPPAPGSRSRPLAALRDALVRRGEEIGLGEMPSTTQKRLLGRALKRLDQAGPAFLDDLRAAVPVFRLVDRGFPGDPVFDPVGEAALEALRQEAHGEQQGLLAWSERARTRRDRQRLQRGSMRINYVMNRYEDEPRRPERARLLLAASRIVERTRRSIDLDPPRIDPPPFQGTAPDFLLLDQNPSSGTAGRTVSPRDLQGKVAAFFFMAST